MLKRDVLLEWLVLLHRPLRAWKRICTLQKLCTTISPRLTFLRKCHENKERAHSTKLKMEWGPWQQSNDSGRQQNMRECSYLPLRRPVPPMQPHSTEQWIIQKNRLSFRSWQSMIFNTVLTWAIPTCPPYWILKPSWTWQFQPWIFPCPTWYNYGWLTLVPGIAHTT